MFESIGRRGHTKKLSPYRWLASAGIGVVLGSLFWVGVSVIDAAPSAKAEEKVDDVEVKFVVSKPPPPPPPRPAPRATTRPLKNMLTKQVVKKEIKEPEPTPKPDKEEEPKPTEV